MATLHGYKSLENKNLIVYRSYSNSVPYNMESLTVQLDQSLLNPDKVLAGDKVADSNPYLTTMRLKNGFVTHALRYTKEQFERIRKAAGDSVREVDGKGCFYGINASLIVTKNGFVIDTDKSITKTENRWFGMKTLDKQRAVTEAAKKHREYVKN